MKLWTNAVTLERGGTRILNDLSVAIPEGQITMVLGPNGAGKTSLLRVMAGLEPQLRQGVLVNDGTSLAGLSARERAKLIAWVPDHVDLPFAFSALEVVVMGRFAHHEGFPSRHDEEKAQRALEDLGLAAKATRSYQTLSSGERQKIQVARALASEAPLLILDEPCASLDVKASLELLGILKKLATLGRTVVLSQHDLTLVRSFATNTIFLASGRLATQGRTEDVFTISAIEKTFGIRGQEVEVHGKKKIFFE